MKILGNATITFTESSYIKESIKGVVIDFEKEEFKYNGTAHLKDQKNYVKINNKNRFVLLLHNNIKGDGYEPPYIPRALKNKYFYSIHLGQYNVVKIDFEVKPLKKIKII